MNPVISRIDLAFVEKAATYLENPSLLAALADKLGKPVEWLLEGIDMLSPVSTADLIDYMLRGIMQGAAASVSVDPLDLDFQAAIAKSLRDGRRHTATTAATGGVSGIFGLLALAIDLPLTTGVMFRSIAVTARNFGEDLADPLVFLDCVSVFSYGGGGSSADAMDSAYLTLRASIASEVQMASRFLAKHTGEAFAQQLARGNCPAMLSFMSRVAARFNIALTPKIAAFLVPGISIASGALINAAFTQHFNRVAEYHFGLKRLARTHGEDVVYGEYRAAAERASRIKVPPRGRRGLKVVGIA